MTPSNLSPLRRRMIRVWVCRKYSSNEENRALASGYSKYLHQTAYRQNKNRPKQQHSANVDPSYPSFTLDTLGIGKRMKVALMVTFCILGTIETWFWYKALWECRKNSTDPQEV